MSKGTSTGTGANISLSTLSLLTANSGNVGHATGSAPAAYNTTSPGLLNLDVGLPGVLSLLASDGTFSTNVSSTIDGSSGSKTTKATSGVTNLNLGVGEVLGLFGTDPLISLEVPAVTTAVTIAGRPGSFTSTSTVSLAGLKIKLLGATVDLSSIDLTNVPANTGLVINGGALAGVTIMLNETATVGNAFDGFTTTTTAIKINLTAAQLGILTAVSGDIAIGKAQASQGYDPDGDGLYAGRDGDSDGDGIPDAIEIANAAPGGDTDGDGVPDYLDLDSDNDGINDVIEAGGKDANGDGRQDPSGDANPDEDGDGIVDSVDPNDNVLGGTKGVALVIADTDGDGVKNYLDLDSDNDGVSDIVESGFVTTADENGVFRTGDSDGDGIDDVVDGFVGFGDAPGSTGPIPDSDNDGTPNAYDTDSNNDGTPDIVGTPFAALDTNGDGRIDASADSDRDGIPNVADIQPGVFGGLPNAAGDNDGDGIPNGDEGSGQVDTDGDGVPDIADGDSDGDGIPDSVEGNGDLDGDGIPNFRDLDSDNDGINDVIEAGGTDANGDGLQDSSGDSTPDADGDGIVDSVDPDEGGTVLPVTDTDGDGAPNFLDLDSDNDTISDLIESGLGATDSNNDGIGDGPDPDRDGIILSVDGLPGGRGDAGGSTPIDTDGDGIPNYIDPNSDNAGGNDIDTAGNGDLDTDGDGMVDDDTDTDGDGIPDVVDDDINNPGGLGSGLKTYTQWRNEEFTAPANTNPVISGPDADPDQDGFSNAEEFAFGSDPENPGSIPTITSSVPPGGGIELSGVRDPNAYAFVVLQVSRNLQSWSSAVNDVEVTTDQPALLIGKINSSFGGDQSRGFLRFHIIIP
ncbi:hypothetical protein OKA04_19290 [Luteolibacter flavescens]|uniref:Uncharacterized protein n=1 Tax=Luteolibacter flavescens TaxID=1859460 RepID=A0ABT3FTI3_9BACT|nr:hypothetical protein [Luteolibacter flavescens]MCW1886893.1 hypothetical protein [Luteolibacter flavescens]